LDKTSLKALPTDDLKALLSAGNISTRDIAAKCSLSQSTVALVINSQYNGSAATADKVYSQIANMLEGREDLSDDIYTNITTVSKLLHVGINSAKFTIPEKEFLISLHKKLTNYKEAKHE